MEKLSRTKKYAELHDTLSNDAESQVTSSDLSMFSDRLKRIDSSSFDSVEIKEEQNHNPSHLAKNDVMESDTLDLPINTEVKNGFNNEYLDEYIREIKQYNLKKGYISNESTSADIFNSMKEPQTDQEFTNGVFDCPKKEVVLSDFKVINEAETDEFVAQNVSISEELNSMVDEETEIVEEEMIEQEKQKPSKLRSLFFIEDETINSFEKISETEELSIVKNIPNENDNVENALETSEMFLSEIEESMNDEKTQYSKEEYKSSLGLNPKKDYISESNNTVLNTILVVLILIVSFIALTFIYWILTA